MSHRYNVRKYLQFSCHNAQQTQTVGTYIAPENGGGVKSCGCVRSNCVPRQWLLHPSWHLSLHNITRIEYRAPLAPMFVWLTTYEHPELSEWPVHGISVRYSISAVLRTLSIRSYYRIYFILKISIWYAGLKSHQKYTKSLKILFLFSTKDDVFVFA